MGGVLLLSVIVSLLSGYDSSIGYYMSLSRVFCFLPFFVAGYYAGHSPKNVTFSKYKKILLLLCVLFIALAEIFIMRRPEIFSNGVLYGSYSYAALGHNWKHRAILMAVGFLWIIFLFLTVSSKKNRVVSTLGKNSLPIFLFHGFFIKIVGHFNVFRYTELKNLLLSAGIAMGIVLLLGNPVMAWICKWLFTGNWIAALKQKCKKVYLKS